jgi:hypothetical protein
VHATGTSVGGIIWSNTTWTLANSPYIITDTVQIPENVTLTLEPGVIVTSDLGWHENMFLLNGVIYAHGFPDAVITFDGNGNSNFFAALNANENTFLDLRYCIVQNGRSLYPNTGVGAYLNVTYSTIRYVYEPSTIMPTKDVFIEHNIFIDYCSFVAGGQGGDVYIRNNLFVGRSSFSGDEYYTVKCISHDVYVNHNSFFHNNKVLQLYPGFEASMNATENYWGTHNSTLIDSMIYDRNDDITCAGFIEYLPILTEPHSDTPKIPPKLSVTHEGEVFTIFLDTSSTLLGLTFTQSMKEIRCIVTGEERIIGFCNSTFPIQLLGGPYIVLIDGVQVTPIETSNTTHTSLFFTYAHSSHTIEIVGATVIPEFPTMTLMMILLSITSLTLLVKSKSES